MDEKTERRVKAVIDYSSRKVPFYVRNRRLYSSKNFESFPVINRNFIEKNQKSFLSSDYRDYKLRLHYRLTSGSSGKPLKVFFNPLFFLRMNFFYLKMLINSGYRLHRKLFHYDPARPYNYFFQRLGLFRRTWIDASLDESTQLKILANANNYFISYFPTSLLFVLLEATKNRYTLKPPDGIFSQAELLFNPVRERIENMLEANVVDLYGCAEHGFIAYEIEKNIYKVSNELAFLEIVDKNNEQVGEGERGRILLTTVGNTAFPLVRYEIGDFATVVELDSNYKAIRNINRVSLENALKKRKLVEKLIEKNLDRKKFSIIYRNGKFITSNENRFLQKHRGKYDFLRIA